MAEDSVDLRFIGQQLQRVQTDLREVQSDLRDVQTGLGEVKTDQARLQAEVHGEISELKGSLDAFRESVVDRFEQMTNLIKLSFRAIDEKYQSMNDKLDQLLRRD